MAIQRKSPREKKDLELKKDHFTFAEYPHRFRKAWPRKKALASRAYRRKSQQLLSPAKREISADDAEMSVGDVKTGHLKSSVTRKRLHK